MNRTPDPFQTVPKSYFSSFVRTSTLIVACGALITAAGFYFARREGGASYADSFKLIAELDRVLIVKSLALFSFTTLLMLAGVIIISIAYSHRVAGPLFKLGMISKKIASGDLAETVRLRRNDVLHELADDINAVSRRYRDLLSRIEISARELAAIMDKAEKHAPSGNGQSSTDEISERIDELRELLNQIRL